jgi:hypothetical protein
MPFGVATPRWRDSMARNRFTVISAPTAVRSVRGGTGMGAYPEVGMAAPPSSNDRASNDRASDDRAAGGLSVVAWAMRDADRRVVAIAPDAMELLRPSSDLARLLESFGRADVLLVAEDVPTAVDEDDPDDWTHDAEATDEVRTAAAALGHPDLVVHRLGLDQPINPGTEDELVAALSELVGFDPEPGVYCLAPASPDGGAVARAAQRIAQVYGLPLLRYRCLELSVVDGMDEAG